MVFFDNPNRLQWATLIQRPEIKQDDIDPIVSEVFESVRTKGDEALGFYTQKFDKINLTDFRVSKQTLTNSERFLQKGLKDAIQKAKSNIHKFHEAQISNRVEVETTEGVLCYQEKRPIQKVGIYIPGGTAPLFSTVLMLGVPAQIAGCKDIVMVSPPNSNGDIAPEILFTASICGIDSVYKIGGIQGVAALTFGTESIPKVYKICGPGNQYVTYAKQYATKFGVSIDMPAGPSELLIIADDTAVPEYVAADMLSQAEHGIDSQVILLGSSKEVLTQVDKEMKKQCLQLPRKHIAEAVLEKSKFILFNEKSNILDFVNEYAPEHLIICSKEEGFFEQGILNAGSVFLGNYTPESAGDYASGTNHTLPTNGFSKNYSGVNLDTFQKAITFQKISKQGLENLGPAIEKMADAEGLKAHRNAVSIRLKE